MIAMIELRPEIIDSLLLFAVMQSIPICSLTEPDIKDCALQLLSY